MLALMILGALAAGFGLLMIVPLATIAINGTGCRTPRIDAQTLRFGALDPTWNREDRGSIFGGGMISARVHMG